MNKIYLAYGSNMNLAQMAHRCPTARVLGSMELPGYRLLFRGGNGNAVATIEPYEHGRVPALLWEITPQDEAALDRYEGWPHLYRKETLTIDFKGRPVSAMVYIMNDGRPMGGPGLYYYNVILDGYRDAGLRPDTLLRAARYSAKPLRRMRVE